MPGPHQRRFRRRHDVRDAPDLRRDDGHARGHRLEQDDGCALGSRAQDEHIEGGEEALGFRYGAMPVDLTVQAETPCPRRQRQPLGSVPDEGDRKGKVLQVRDRIEQHVGAFFRTQTTDPPDDEVVGRKAEHAAGFLPIEGRHRRSYVAPRVRHFVDARRGNPGSGEPRHERPRHRDDGVEFPERAALQPLVDAVLPPAARETVHGGDDRDPETARYVRVEDVGAIAVRVHDVGPQLAAQPAHRCALLETAPHDQGMRLHAGVGEGREKRFVGAGFRGARDRDDVHVMSRADEARPQQLNDAFKTAKGTRSDYLEDYHCARVVEGTRDGCRTAGRRRITSATARATMAAPFGVV